MMIDQSTARQMMEVLYKRQKVLSAIPLHLLTLEQAEELVQVSNALLQAQTDLARAPRGMYGKDGSVR